MLVNDVRETEAFLVAKAAIDDVFKDTEGLYVRLNSDTFLKFLASTLYDKNLAAEVLLYLISLDIYTHSKPTLHAFNAIVYGRPDRLASVEYIWAIPSKYAYGLMKMYKEQS